LSGVGATADGERVTIATWNVNSVRARIAHLVDWLKAERPDIVLLQETKCADEQFPAEPVEELGYNLALFGEKARNGVAILARRPIEDVVRGLPGDPDDGQARYLEATVGTLRVASIYLPNGNPVDSGKFPYKLAWLERLRAHLTQRLWDEEILVLGGDYNVIPEPIDCHDPAAWEGDALFRPETRRAFRALLHLGLTDAFRACEKGPRHYTFWDYQGGAWQHDHGIRIDHHLLSPQAADRLLDARINRTPRGWKQASDHVPVLVTLAA
jgi:exodeoxyribonuclease III